MRSALPTFAYYISGFSGALSSGNPLWQTPLASTKKPKQGHPSPEFTIGDYFKYATLFLGQERYRFLKQGLAFHFHREVGLEEVAGISLFLEKHGAFYHPTRVEVKLNTHTQVLTFALNAAISDMGLALMAKEYNCLKRLLPQPGLNSSLPAVFGFGKMSCEKGDISFFLAHWFKGYQEFHVTDSRQNIEHIALWQSDGSAVKMAPAHHVTLYDKASEILTSFYSPHTFEQIFPWHHAAGDFIVKEINGLLDVKLITVRGYGALFDIDKPPEKRNMEEIFQGLLLFLVNLSLRMRIDRVDGTGGYHLVHSDAIKATLKGFFRALGDKIINGYSQDALKEKFYRFLMQFDDSDFKEILTLILNAHPHPEMEEKLIKKNLDSHAKDLYHAIQLMGKN
ncbi:MAG: hypothetical protein QM498_03240 [Desulfobacterium sp.]